MTKKHLNKILESNTKRVALAKHEIINIFLLNKRKSMLLASDSCPKSDYGCLTLHYYIQMPTKTKQYRFMTSPSVTGLTEVQQPSHQVITIGKQKVATDYQVLYLLYIISISTYHVLVQSVLLQFCPCVSCLCSNVIDLC